MPNNTIQKIDEALATLATEKSIEAGLSLASFLLRHMSTAGIKSTDSNSADFILLTALKLPNAERYDHWFQAHPKFKSDRACFALNDIKQGPIEAKLYALKTKKKLYISGAAHFTPNFEDALFTRQDPNAKVGIDFFLPPSNDSLLVVVSNNKSLRVVELKDRLTNTQKDIFAKWSNVASLEREQLHLTIWDSFKLKSINEAFYKGIANSFKDLVSHLEGAGKSSNEARHFANRLHGRLLFCWFLDKKGFINREVNYFDTTHTDATQYYKDKLELLFFDTLNTPQNERERSHPDQKTPYLNGGLFEAQPDDWRGSNVPFPQGFFVRLYEHFGEFNFTTDESTPDYEQIAIDPEMLGKIFENLLAEINEDTGEQARKAKGAFYTPREIVVYMCRESVREYLYTATKAGDKAKIAIDKLLDTSDSDWAKSGTNSRRDTGEATLREKIIEALDEMKVLDPACGSGAFPIGMLHLLVQLYERLDGRFDAYKTKLGIMERNIYGVDIEPLAIEIARLRSFLALVVDQEYVEKKPNGGIDTLPNLEFKFVCANTLIPLTRQSSLGDSGKYETLLEIKKEYFKADPKKREKLETKYSTLRKQGTMFDSRLNEQLQTYDPFNNDHPAGFYDRHLMHDISSAFSVVLGNPPYVQLSSKKITPEEKKLLLALYGSSMGRLNTFGFFTKMGIGMLEKNGIQTFIIPNTILTQEYYEELRRFLIEETQITQIVDIKTLPFESAVVENVILINKNCQPLNPVIVVEYDGKCFIKAKSISQESFKEEVNFNFNIRQSEKKLINLTSKIKGDHKKLKDIFNINQAIALKGSRNKWVTKDGNDSKYKKVLVGGRNINKYTLNWTGEYLNYTPEAIHSSKNPEIFEADEKIFFRRVSRNLIATIDTEHYYALHTIVVITPKSKGSNNQLPLKYVLGIFNSKLFNFYYNQLFASTKTVFSEIGAKKIAEMPIATSSDDLMHSVQKAVENALKAGQSGGKTKVYEDEIDSLVYKIYDLTPDEIALIEG